MHAMMPKDNMLPVRNYLAGYDIGAYGAGIGLKPAYHTDDKFTRELMIACRREVI